MIRSELEQTISASPRQPHPERVCAVHYLNTLPLVWGLLGERQDPRITLSMASPAACAARLRQGQAELGLVPVAEIARQGLPVLPGTCISSDGPVRSILLVSRVPWQEVRTLAADANSRTSVVLAQIVLRERFGARVSVEAQPPSLPEMLSQADSALLIGDAALHVEPAALPHGSLACSVLDLGEEWQRLTGLPMVFAAWAGPAAIRCPWLEPLLRESLAWGEANLEAIVKQEARKHGVAEDLAYRYLSGNIRFHLGSRERAGMAEFLRRGEALGLILPGESRGAAGDHAAIEAGDHEAFEEVNLP